MKEAREAKTQKQMWEVIKKKRRRKIEVNKKIRMEEWDNYFRGMLGDSKWGIQSEKSIG